MRWVWFIMFFASNFPATAADPPGDLDHVAQAATAMLDGDLCQKIQTPRSARYMTLKDPRDPWRAGDNYDVNDAPFTQTKKTLIRLSHLCPGSCDVNLWMPLPAKPQRVQIVIRNVHELSQFWNWGDLDQDMPPEMKRVLDSGERVKVSRRRGMFSVLAPVKNSLGDVVAVAEVVTQQNEDPRENVK
ncbi:MAG TPA: hypothetical protein DEQ47_16645 [Solibacterales bacterium]|nr:hypothetical protein [Bryobacterales bacterium]